VKTVNNVLTVLSTILKVAAKWKVTERMHAQIESLKVPPPGFSFYEFDEYEALVEAAERCGLDVLIAVLLGGDAGLRMGEMIALEQSDLDFRRLLEHPRTQRTETYRQPRSNMTAGCHNFARTGYLSVDISFPKSVCVGRRFQAPRPAEDVFSPFDAEA
jgi:integrase